MCICAKDAKTHIKTKKAQCELDKELAIDTVLNSLPIKYDQFILTYHWNNMDTKIIELHTLLQTTEPGMKKSHSNKTTTTPILVI